MPSPYNKKYVDSAIARMNKKYVMVDEDENPRRIYPPLKDGTNKLKDMMGTKNYIKILTQIGTNKFILVQHYIYCEDDLWLCGDAIVLNQNPDKKILTQVLCTKTRKECCAYHEYSHEYITLCPNCRKIIVMCKHADTACQHCNCGIGSAKSMMLPFLKLDCEFCPVKIGWDKVNEIHKNDKNFYQGLLKIRSDILQQLRARFDDVEFDGSISDFYSKLTDQVIESLESEEKHE